MSNEGFIVTSPVDSVTWEKYLIGYFIKAYREYKQRDKYNVLFLDEDKLRGEFASKYKEMYNQMKTSDESPDRHKIIAMLTKAFLETAPFSSNCDRNRFYDEMERVYSFPNEFFALKICKYILTYYGRKLKNIPDYEFFYPETAYVYSSRNMTSSYGYELYVLYREYSNTYRLSGENAGFSIYLMAHHYFMLEVACDLAYYNQKDKYYLPTPVAELAIAGS